MKVIVYSVIKMMAKISVYSYFRGIEINGKENIPTHGKGYIYAVNHQNALIDAIIVGSLAPTPVYFLTRASVFDSPYRWFLEMLNMMPIYRIRDGYSSISKNDEIFENCEKLLMKGSPILIFPEGNHGEDYYLRPLTKGISRIALHTYDRVQSELYILPVGINYFNHFHSGHKLILNYGKPLNIKESFSVFEEHNNKGYKDLLNRLKPAIQEVMVIPEKEDHYSEQKQIFRRSNESKDFDEMRALAKSGTYPPTEKQYPWVKPIGLLLEIPNWPPFLLLKYVLNKKVKDRIFTSSIKIAMAILILPIWFLITFIFVLLCLGWLWAMIFLSIQIISLFLRRELVRFNRDIF